MSNEEVVKQLELMVNTYVKGADVQSDNNEFIENMIRFDVLVGARDLADILGLNELSLIIKNKMNSVDKSMDKVDKLLG